MGFDASTDRRQALAGLAALGAVASLPRTVTADVVPTEASYRVAWPDPATPRFRISARVPAAALLRMADSYPAELPRLAKGGWPALISGLTAKDLAGRPLDIVADGPAGWKLPNPPKDHGHIDLSYKADLSVFADAGWSSPLESAVRDEEHLVVCGRALFIASPATTRSSVIFDLPASWRAVAPWRPVGSASFDVAALEDLTDNMLAFSRTAPDIAVGGDFTLQITAMGHWAPLRPLIAKALKAIIQREVALMGYRGQETYNVVLIPTQDQGGEAYRQSFAYCFKDPSPETLPQWANTLAHEIFHYWNYARLKGADYASTQWFQEGFTEYVANITLMQGGVAGSDVFLAKLGQHIGNARRLTTTLENIGTHKGPPLYSAGALTAFSFDVMIRQASGGRRSLGNFFRALWRLTNAGAKPYAWRDIRAALEAVAPGDWQGFYDAHIEGAQPLPVDEVLAMAGLKRDGDQASLDPAAPAQAKALWRGLMRG